MAKKAKRITRPLRDEDRRKYRDIRRQLEGEPDEILAEARRRQRVHDTLTAELRQAFRILKPERLAQGLSLAEMHRTGMSRSAISRQHSHIFVTSSDFLPPWP